MACIQETMASSPYERRTRIRQRSNRGRRIRLSFSSTAPWQSLLVLLFLWNLTIHAQAQQQQQQQHHLLRSTSSWPTQGSLQIDSMTIVSDFDQITILGEIHITPKGKLVLEGTKAKLFALELEWQGLINLVVRNDNDEDQDYSPINLEGDMRVDEAKARLAIDASDFATTGTASVLPLIKYSSHTGILSPRKVMIVGLDPSLHAEVVNGPDSLDLILTENTAYQQPKPQKQQDADFHTLFKEASLQETNHRYHLFHPEEQ